MNRLLMIGTSLVLLLLAAAVYYTLTQKKEKYEDARYKVMLFYATWCPHCERYLESGKFDEFGTKIHKKYPDVAFVKYDYDKNKDIGDSYGVNSFPTIIAEDGSKKTFRFYGDRMSYDDVDKFVSAVVKGKQLGREEY